MPRCGFLCTYHGSDFVGFQGLIPFIFFSNNENKYFLCHPLSLFLRLQLLCLNLSAISHLSPTVITLFFCASSWLCINLTSSLPVLSSASSYLCSSFSDLVFSPSGLECPLGNFSISPSIFLSYSAWLSSRALLGKPDTWITSGVCF